MSDRPSLDATHRVSLRTAQGLQMAAARAHQEQLRHMAQHHHQLQQQAHHVHSDDAHARTSHPFPLASSLPLPSSSSSSSSSLPSSSQVDAVSALSALFDSQRGQQRGQQRASGDAQRITEKKADSAAEERSRHDVSQVAAAATAVTMSAAAPTAVLLPPTMTHRPPVVSFPPAAAPTIAMHYAMYPTAGLDAPYAPYGHPALPHPPHLPVGSSAAFLGETATTTTTTTMGMQIQMQPTGITNQHAYGHQSFGSAMPSQQLGDAFHHLSSGAALTMPSAAPFHGAAPALLSAPPVATAATATAAAPTVSPYQTTRLPILHPWYFAHRRAHPPKPLYPPPPVPCTIDLTNATGFSQSLRASLRIGLPTVSICVPVSDLSVTPQFVHAKQWARFVNRSAARRHRAHLAALAGSVRNTGAAKHLSRQLHAARRVRGKGGRFLTKEERAKLVAEMAGGEPQPDEAEEEEAHSDD